jgi:GAF domain-containing protein
VSRRGSADSELADLMERLRADLALSRATLRLDVTVPGREEFPMTHEALAPGVDSVAGKVVPADGHPTVERILRDRTWLVVDDCVGLGRRDSDFDRPVYWSMLETYGGLAAFIAAPLFEEDRLVAILSLHHLGSPRVWSGDERDVVSGALEQIDGLRIRYGVEAQGEDDHR